MPARIETFPLGLRELLGRGDPPTNFTFHPEVTLPVIDIERFLLIQSRQQQQVQESTGIAAGAVARITVPDGELWWLHWVEAATDLLDADQSTHITPSIRTSGRAFHGEGLAVGNSEIRFATILPGALNGLILRPGDEILVGFSSAVAGAAATIQYETNVLYSQLGA